MRNERGAGTALIVLAVIGALALPFVIWGASVVLAPLFGKGEAFKQTERAEYRIANYERFKNDCNAIVAQDAKIANAQDAVDSEVRGKVNTFREQQVVQNLQALENVRAEQIAEYNAAASMNETRAKFKDAGLPDYIYPDTEIGAITCPSD